MKGQCLNSTLNYQFVAFIIKSNKVIKDFIARAKIAKIRGVTMETEFVLFLANRSVLE